MKKKFASTSNAQAFLAGLAALQNRGAPEASWMLVTGLPGLGKTKLVEWYCTQQSPKLIPGVYLRAKTSWTPRGMMAELISRLGMAPLSKSNELFAQALGMLGRDPHAVVIDEVEHCLRDVKVLEAVHDLSDLTEVPVILVGMDTVKTRIQRHEQISSRITQVVEITASSLDDVATMARELLPELQFADDLLEKIHKETEGRYRLIMDALALIEREARRNKTAQVNAEMFPDQLVHDWRIRTRRVNGKQQRGAA